LASNQPPQWREGRFEWDAQGRSIVLSDGGLTGALLVGENRLFLLNAQGEREADARAASYTLEKAASSAQDWGLFGQTWQLAEHDGLAQGVPNGARPYFTLDAQTLAVRGFSGCNRFFGSVVLAAEQGVRFGRLGVTKMACAAPNVERDFLQALAQVAFWRVSESGLLLLDAAQRPLLVLSAVASGQ
jgi:heat shock protein HslJ